MPIQAPQWTDFLSCPICMYEFATQRQPISLACGHTICRTCLATLHRQQCPFDQVSAHFLQKKNHFTFTIFRFISFSVFEWLKTEVFTVKISLHTAKKKLYYFYVCYFIQFDFIILFSYFSLFDYST